VDKTSLFLQESATEVLQLREPSKASVVGNDAYVQLRSQKSRGAFLVRSQERAPSLQVAAGSFNIVSADGRVRITVIIRIQKGKARPLDISFVRENALCKFAPGVYPVIVNGDILCGSRPMLCIPDKHAGEEFAGRKEMFLC